MVPDTTNTVTTRLHCYSRLNISGFLPSGPLPLEDAAAGRRTHRSPQRSADGGCSGAAERLGPDEARELKELRRPGTQRERQRPQQPCGDTRTTRRHMRGATVDTKTRWALSLGSQRTTRRTITPTLVQCIKTLNIYRMRRVKIRMNVKLWVHTGHPPCQGGRHVSSWALAVRSPVWTNFIPRSALPPPSSSQWTCISLIIYRNIKGKTPNKCGNYSFIYTGTRVALLDKKYF